MTFRALARALSSITPLVALVLAAGCAPPEAPDTRAQDEAAIRAVEAAWSRSINTKSVDTFVSNYSADAVVLAPNEPMSTGADAIRKSISSMMALPGLDMTFQPTAVKVAKAGDMAVSYGTYQLSVTGPDGKPMQDRGKYVTVWAKQSDGSWKSAVDTFNSDMPMPSMEPPVAAGKKK